VRSGDEGDSRLTFLGRGALPFSRGHVLLLTGALFAELPDHLFPQARSFGEYVVEPIKDLFQVV
jgi:hypothetical protein